MISNFRGEYYYLSNMYPCPVIWKGVPYKCAESVFQAMKTLDLEVRRTFTFMDGFAAKRAGKRVNLRRDWNSIREELMHEIVLAKFEQNPKLSEMLIATGTEHIEEQNTWNDKYWGVCNGVGENKLGLILMTVREELSK